MVKKKTSGKAEKLTAEKIQSWIILGAIIVFVAILIINETVPIPAINIPIINYPIGGKDDTPIDTPDDIPYQPDGKEEEQVFRFKSESDFKNYLKKVASLSDSDYFGSMMGGEMTRTMDKPIFFKNAITMPTDGKELSGNQDTSRVSETNVQVMGIDEPDIVKTDGNEIYFSSWNFNVSSSKVPIPEPGGIISKMIAPDYYQRGGTKAIKAFPPAQLKEKSAIGKRGDLLLSKNTLVIFGNREISGYDVSDPSSPSEEWNIKYKDNTRKQDARLYNDKIYLITRTDINQGKPCPVVPLELSDTDIRIPCAEIYHPIAPTPADSTFNIMKINPANGEVEDQVSFVGSSRQSVVYMSADAIYLTYNFKTDLSEFAYDFFNKEARDLMSKETINKIDKLSKYDISSAAKLLELKTIFWQFTNSLDDDEQARTENELTNRLDDYLQKNMRKLERTGIAKVATKGLDIKATGSVPGKPLNQFSLDEYQGNLRIATTVSGQFFFGGRAESENDVYVLDNNLETIGSAIGMGLNERIYSVRFVQDKGYVVTFRQMDPFYVLDLSNPQNPEIKGELKIPGFSSYLHPLADNTILGIGREGGKVKLSMFDVSSPEKPIELDKYMLSEYWTDVQNTHHAFLADQDNQIFFLPAGQKGFIFSYENNKLSLKRAVTNINARRAIYINNYLYVIGDRRIVVLNESDWEEVNSLDLR